MTKDIEDPLLPMRGAAVIDLLSRFMIAVADAMAQHGPSDPLAAPVVATAISMLVDDITEKADPMFRAMLIQGLTLREHQTSGAAQ